MIGVEGMDCLHENISQQRFKSYSLAALAADFVSHLVLPLKYLDRKDVCSMSCVHRKEFLVVQRIPDNGMLVIRARGQQAKRNRREVCIMDSSVPSCDQFLRVV